MANFSTQCRLGDLISIKHGFAFKSEYFSSQGPFVLLTPGNFVETGGFRWLEDKQKFYDGPVPDDFILNSGDMLIAMTEQAPGLLGSTFFLPEGQKYLHNQRLGLIRVQANEHLVDRYLHYYLSLPETRRIISAESTGTKVKHTSPERLYDLNISLPSLNEQRKIVEILRTWDDALEKLVALRASKVRHINSVRQRLFEAEYVSGDRLQRVKELFETVSERNRSDLPLLAVMQGAGIVRRDELDRRVAMPDGDTLTYKVVRPGDFIISLRSFEGGLEYSSITGLVSPAYTVLRPTADIVGDYYRHFFKSRSFIGRLDKMIFGIRDGKQIAFRDFGDMYVPTPPVCEQETRTGALNCLEADLALEDNRIATLTYQKRGLMQKLLTGEWSVSC